MRRLVTLLALLALLGASIAGCAEKSGGSTSSEGTTGSSATTGASGSTSSTNGGNGSAAVAKEALTVSYDLTDLDFSWDEASSSFITLADSTVRFDGSGGVAKGDKVTITAAGTYVVTGRSDDVQIVVDCKEHGLVRLVLNNADLTCSDSAPIYVKNAEKVILILADGTKNAVTDGPSYVLEADSNEPNAAIFSKADLTINGKGSLSLTANYNDGITSKDELRIVSGDLTIQAKNDAIKGKDCLGVKEAGVTITAGGDGLQATNDTDPAKGFVDISGGTFDITAGADGIQATTTLLVSAGDLSLVTGGGSASGRKNTPMDGGRTTTTVPVPGHASTTTTVAATQTDQAGGSSGSAKGLKAGGGLFVKGGNISVDSADDSLHSSGAIRVSGGTFKLASGDDAVHADASVTIDGGDMSIGTCYEGIESNAITLNDGTVRLTATDDGVNGIAIVDAAGQAATKSTAGASTKTGKAGAATTPSSGPGASTPTTSSNKTIDERYYNASLTIAGGYLAVDSGGDGIDVNGKIKMTGGTVVINGPTTNNDGAIDYMGGFVMTGGYLVAAGSSGRAEAPDEDSTQCSILIHFNAVQAAGTVVHVQGEAGNDIATMAPAKRYRSLVVCSPEIKQGGTYTVYLGGSSTGTPTDTLYGKGTYSGGAKFGAVTVTGVVTVFGTPGGMGSTTTTQGGNVS